MEGGGNGTIADPQNGGNGTLLVLQLKPIATYKSNDEYLIAMKEDLADWFTCLYKLTINVDNFFEVLETGVMLCEHANKVRNFANEQKKLGVFTEMHSNFVRDIKIPQYEVQYRINVKPQTFQARDNISNFISWTKKMGLPDVLCFETDDLVLRKNEKSVVLCLLEIARVGAKLGMLAPTLVKMEEEIDAEIAGEPPKQIKTCDVKSLHEMVKELAGRCTCPVQFPIIKVGEGKYKIGDTQTLVFVRILRNHVMIRVGGGWDTLEHYLDKHDPCRCGFSGHKVQQTPRPAARRSSTGGYTHSQSTPNTPRSPRKMSVGPNVSASAGGNTSLAQRPASPARMRSMSPSPASSPRKLPSQPGNITSHNYKSTTSQNSSIPAHTGQQKTAQPQNTRRSQSPVPSKLRSPSPSPAISHSAQVTTTPARSHVVPVKRCTSPAQPKRCVSPSPAKRCTSPAPNRGCVSPGPNRKPSSLSVARSKPTTPRAERRQLPRRPSGSMEFSGNISEGTDLSPDMNPSVSMDAISTMTLDQFKNLISNALSVPNGHNSENSLDSPRSQSSTDSLRHTYSVNSAKKRSSLNDATQKYKTWATRRDISKSFDSDCPSRQGGTLKSSQSQDSDYYELDKPAKRPPAVSTISRPKTPVSSVQRPKTPVSSSVPRPKTPTAYSNIRSTNPVNTASRPKTPISNVTSKIDTGLSSFKRPTAAPLSFTRPKTPTRLQNNSETVEPQLSAYNTEYDDTRHQTLSIYKPEHIAMHEDASSVEKENDSRLSNLTPRKYSCDIIGDFYSRSSESDSRQSNLYSTRSGSEPPTHIGSCIKSDDSYISGVKTHSVELESNVTSKPESESRPTTLSFTSGSNSSSKTDVSAVDAKPPSPNIGYVALKSVDMTDSSSTCSKIDESSYFSKTYQNYRRLSTETNQSVSNSVSDSSLSERSDSIRGGSVERNFGSSGQGSCYSIDSSPSKEETGYNNRQNILNPVRSNSFPCDSVDKEEKKEIVLKPSTPARPSTPSLIPRPSTPSFIPRPSTPLSNLKDSIDKLERQPAYSSNTSVKNTTGRPPTPRKATIIAKAPSSNNSEKCLKDNSRESSYTSMFLSRRSKTPGPTSRSTDVNMSTPRRSRTPGPGERSGSCESLKKTDNVNSQFDYSDNRMVRSKALPSNQAVQRRPRTPSMEAKPLTRQNASDGTTVITVNRSSGKHVLTVEGTKETKSTTSKPTSAKIIARSPTAQLQRNTQQENDTSRGRTRTKVITPQTRPPRPKSVEPGSLNRTGSKDEVLTVENKKEGTHFLTNRMEAWVESAVKNTATKTVKKAAKHLPPRPQRSKTPNPGDFHEYELQSRPLEEIKAVLSLPVNGLKELDTDNLDAPPEDPEMYAKLDDLFQKLKEKELKASVNETPGSGPEFSYNEGLDGNEPVNSDELSLDSNENVKRRSSKGSSSYKQSPSSSNRGSVPSTPTRSKKSPFSRESSQVCRVSSTPPRPPTPTRSGSTSRRSSSNSHTSSNSVPVAHNNVHGSPETHADLIVSKIKEIMQTKPRPEDNSGFKSRIPAPKSLSSAGKSKSFSNLSSANASEGKPNRQLSNGSLNKENYYYEDDCGQEISRYSSNGDVTDYTECSDTFRSGTETPVPKLTMPLTTGRKEYLKDHRDANNRTPKLVRAVSISSLSSSSNTLSYTVGDDEEFV